MVIRIRDIVGGADTAGQGQTVFRHLVAAFAKDGTVTVSFDGLQTATSSFVNASFVALLQVYPLAVIKQRMKVTSSTRQINDMIKTRLQREALAAA